MKLALGRLITASLKGYFRNFHWYFLGGFLLMYLVNAIWMDYGFLVRIYLDEFLSSGVSIEHLTLNLVITQILESAVYLLTVSLLVLAIMRTRLAKGGSGLFGPLKSFPSLLMDWLRVFPLLVLLLAMEGLLIWSNQSLLMSNFWYSSNSSFVVLFGPSLFVLFLSFLKGVLLTGFCLAWPVAVGEKTRWLKSLGRSWALTRGSRFKFFILLVGLHLLGVISNLLLGRLFPIDTAMPQEVYRFWLPIAEIAFYVLRYGIMAVLLTEAYKQMMASTFLEQEQIDAFA